MYDFGKSDHADLQRQLDRITVLAQPQGRIGLDAIAVLLARLGDPQLAMPPVFHVAGTNGKGSTTAFLRAMLEAQGLHVHATISPHLVRYNERIRLAGELIADADLATLLREVLDTGADLECSFFEVTIAASLLAFSRTPGDACIVEVGLGGRLDATNVLPSPACCGIASLGIDHERFLLSPEPNVPEAPLARIAWEKAGIAKPGVPLVTQAYQPDMTRTIIEHAMLAGARTAMRDLDWSAEVAGATISYRDRHGALSLPLPTLPGSHQADNAALAVAMLRHQSQITVSPEAMAAGIRAARWPARLQVLGEGPLTALVPGRRVWLDGGHNVDAGLAIARFFADCAPFHLITGMLTSKDPAALVAPLRGKLLSLSAVPAPDHEAHQPDAFAAHSDLPVGSFADVPSALAALSPGGDVLIAGSLYLAGEVLRLNAELPD